MVRKRFVVGGNGRRSGLAITTRGAMELRILVVPKLWEAAGDTASGPLDGNAAVEVGRSLTIVVSEGTEFVLRYSGESPLAADLSACLEDLVKVAKRRDADHSRNGTDEVDAGTRRAPLIDRSQRQGKAARINLSFSDEQVPPTVLDLMQTPMRRRRQRRPPRVVRQNAEFFADYWESFQAFWLQSRAGVQDIDLQALGRMSARETARFELRLLVYLAFVRAVTDLLRHVRPAYQRVTQRSSFIRGRMSVASAALVAAGGATHVTCTYDEFGIDSPLLRVIVSALETVSDTKKGEFTARQSMDPAAEAGWLRRQFEGVASLSLAAAARVGAGLQGSLSRLDSDWQVALLSLIHI